MHARLAEGADVQARLAVIKDCLTKRYGITHSTVQIEQGVCSDHAAGTAEPA